MEKIMKIDIHAHANMFPQYYPRYTFGDRMISPEELISFYDRLNIEKGVLLPISSPEGQYSPISSECCKYLSDKYPERFLWFCNVDPRALDNTEHTDLSYLLMHYKSLGARGLGELTANLYADDPKMENLFYHCQECELPVTIHIAPGFKDYGIVDDLGLPRLKKMLKKYPKLKVIGHSQPFWSEISANNTPETRNGYPTGKVTEGALANLLRECDNLYCDFSAGSGANSMMRDREYAARFVEEFSDRLLYGCDICGFFNTVVRDFRNFWDDMLAKGMISEQNYRKIARENAIKILGLEE